MGMDSDSHHATDHARYACYSLQEYKTLQPLALVHATRTITCDEVKAAAHRCNCPQASLLMELQRNMTVRLRMA